MTLASRGPVPAMDSTARPGHQRTWAARPPVLWHREPPVARVLALSAAGPGGRDASPTRCARRPAGLRLQSVVRHASKGGKGVPARSAHRHLVAVIDANHDRSGRGGCQVGCAADEAVGSYRRSPWAQGISTGLIPQVGCEQEVLIRHGD